jgi:hypothetical protein
VPVDEVIGLGVTDPLNGLPESSVVAKQADVEHEKTRIKS